MNPNSSHNHHSTRGESLLEAPVAACLATFEREQQPLHFSAGGQQYHALGYHLEHWDSSRPLLVYLHGYKNNAHSFADLIPRLGYPAVSLDFRGHGQTQGPEPEWIGLPDYLLDVRRLLEHLKASSVWLIGHSLGARAAAVYGALYPEQVARVVLIEGYYRLHVGADWLGRLRRAIEEREAAPKPVPLLTPDRLEQFYLNQTPGMPRVLAKYLVRHSLRIDGEGHAIPDWQSWHNRTTPIAFGDSLLEDAAAQLSMPTLVLQSVKPSIALTEVAPINNHIQLHRVDAGHQLHWEKPLEVAGIIQNWKECTEEG